MKKKKNFQDQKMSTTVRPDWRSWSKMAESWAWVMRLSSTTVHLLDIGIWKDWK